MEPRRLSNAIIDPNENDMGSSLLLSQLLLSQVEPEEKIPPINIVQFVQPKEKDNLIEIVALFKEIFLFQIENGSKFIIFPPIFFKKYLDLSNGINYDNLLS